MPRPAFAIYVFQGIVLVVAVIFDVLLRRRAPHRTHDGQTIRCKRSIFVVLVRFVG